MFWSVVIGCAGGFTGEAQEPLVSYASDRIVIEIDVEPLRLTEAGCPGNEQVEVTVELSEPVGQREIVDGACLERRDLTDCQQATRWSPAMLP